MTTTVTDIETKLAALYAALASGVLRTTHGDTTIEYRTVDDLRKAIADLERLNALGSTSTRRGVNYLYQRGKGL